MPAAQAAQSESPGLQAGEDVKICCFCGMEARGTTPRRPEADAVRDVGRARSGRMSVARWTGEIARLGSHPELFG